MTTLLNLVKEAIDQVLELDLVELKVLELIHEEFKEEAIKQYWEMLVETDQATLTFEEYKENEDIERYWSWAEWAEQIAKEQLEVQEETAWGSRELLGDYKSLNDAIMTVLGRNLK